MQNVNRLQLNDKKQQQQQHKWITMQTKQ